MILNSNDQKRIKIIIRFRLKKCLICTWNMIVNRVSQILIIFYFELDAPVVQLEIEPKIAMESPESIVKLKCLVIEGNPKHLVMVQWFVNGQLIETTFFKDGISQADQLILTNVTRFHAGNYSCRGFNGAKNASEISPAKQLNVLCK